MPYLLFVAFVVVPLLEIFVIIQVGEVIGAGWTIALLVFDSLVGAWLVKREGLRAWQRLTSSFDGGRSPVDELTQGALVVFGGALLLTPGFITDALGLACVLPLTRAPMSALVRRVAGTIAARKMGAGTTTRTTFFMSTGGGGPTRGAGDGQGTGRRPVRPSSGDAGGPSARSSSERANDNGQVLPDVEVLGIERDDRDD